MSIYLWILIPPLYIACILITGRIFWLSNTNAKADDRMSRGECLLFGFIWPIVLACFGGWLIGWLVTRVFVGAAWLISRPTKEQLRQQAAAELERKQAEVNKLAADLKLPVPAIPVMSGEVVTKERQDIPRCVTSSHYGSYSSSLSDFYSP